MNLSTLKLSFQLIKCSNTRQLMNISKSHLLRPSNNAQTMCVTRAVLTRPKELDELRKQNKPRQENQDEFKEREQSERINLFSYILITIPVITFGLGTWQIWRRNWKLTFIQNLQERLKREPVELPENLDDLAKLEYCPIKVRGEFLYDKEFVVGPRSLIVDGHGANEGKGNLISGTSVNRGYNIITPFKVENRDCTILVNRGWLPHKFKHEEERKNSKIEGTVEITGINRLNEKRPQFVFKNVPEKQIWHYRDVYEMADYANTDPIFLDMLESYPGSEMPIAGQTRVNIRNEHLSYIITWFGLSGLTGYYCFRMFIQKRPIF